MVPICIFWCIWKEINLRCFKDLKISMEDILASFFHTLYSWTVAFLSPLLISLLIFLFVFLFLVRCFLLYISSVLKGALRFQ
jgi:hypothetical protein